jgi:surface antigen
VTPARTIGLGALALALASCAALGVGDPSAYDRLTDYDVSLAAHSLQETLEEAQDGETRMWRNYMSGNEGAITPTETYLSDGGYFCRRYREELTVGGGRNAFVHTACRNDAGRWVWL